MITQIREMITLIEKSIARFFIYVIFSNQCNQRYLCILDIKYKIRLKIILTTIEVAKGK